MKLIVGLGNPGKKYERTRHNVGFAVVNGIMQRSKIKDQNENVEFKMNKKANAETYEIEMAKEKILLVKPQTFMNESGKAVKEIFNFQPARRPASPNRGEQGRSSIFNLIVIHDDVDLPFGRIRIQQNGGSAGHHGIESIVQETGTSDFIRVRVGVGKSDIIPTEDFVLMPFTQDEKKQLPTIVTRAANAVIAIIEQGLEKAMNQYNSYNI